MGTEIRTWLGASVDAAGVAIFRIVFGLVMAASAVRFVAKGWIDEMFVAPRFHFAYPGLEWLAPWPAPWLHAHYALMGLAALGVALGYRYRLSALLLFLTFTSAELFDQAYYLNHYYLASLIAALCCVLPLQRAWSLDAWLARRRTQGSAAQHVPATVARAVPLLLRAQLAIVYTFAGLAKLDADWLVRGEPLRTWLQVHAELPLVGPWLQLPASALALSWAGAAFDLTIALWLCLPRTRAAAYLAVIAFHAATALLFPIGVFPWLMIALTPVFFAHDWPRRLLAGFVPAAGTRPGTAQPPARLLGLLPTCALAAYLLVQLALPLRHALYPGAVNWSDEGFRYAWRVMLIEKTGRTTLRVVDRASGETIRVDPRAELTERQYGQMVAQPALIAQYARHVAERFAAHGREVAVYADAWASLNGRPAQRLLDPRIDLARPRPWLAPDPAIAAIEPGLLAPSSSNARHARPPRSRVAARRHSAP